MQITFYFNVLNREKALCQLVGKSLASGKTVCVLTESAAATAALDRLLWEVPQNGFVPHCAADDPRAVLLLGHGAGGKAAGQLIEELFLPALDNPFLRQGDDGAALPLPGDVFAAGCTAYEMVYGKGETAFLAQARAAGCKLCLDGLGMLVCQGAASFRLWTGLTPDVEPVLAMVRAELAA